MYLAIYLLSSASGLIAAVIALTILLQASVPDMPGSFIALQWAIIVALAGVVVYLYRDKERLSALIHKTLPLLTETVESIDQRLEAMERERAINRAVEARLKQRESGGGKDG